MTGRRLLVGSATALVAGLAVAAPARAKPLACGVTEAQTPIGVVDVRLRVVKGDVSCREARRVARRVLSGEAPYHRDPGAADGYYRVGGWHGSLADDGCGATNAARHARIEGHVIGA